MKLSLRKMIAVGVVLATLPSCGSSSPAKERGSATTSRTPEEIAQAAPYRIAGAGLMMTPDQVAAALKSQGYESHPSSTEEAVWSTDSFEEQLHYRLTGHPSEHPRRVPNHEEWAKGHETVSVQYSLYPSDAKAIQIVWKTNDGSPSEAEIRATLAKRYGPGFQLKSFLPPQWCSPSPCSAASAAMTTSWNSIILNAPSFMSQPASFNQRMDAAVRAHDGPTNGSF